MKADKMVSDHPWPRVQLIDPADLVWIATGESPWAGPAEPFDVTPFLDMLPEVEAEVLFLCHVKGKKQSDVGKLMGLSQPTVSFRLDRAIEHLRYFVLLRAVDPRRVLEGVDFLSPRDVEVLVSLAFTLSQSETGRRLGMGQSTVRLIAQRARTQLMRREREDPLRYTNALGLVLFILRHLRTKTPGRQPRRTRPRPA